MTDQSIPSQFPSWVPVGERLPENKPGAWLVFTGRCVAVETALPCWWNRRDERGKEYDGPTVTHWLPLPPLPNEESNEALTEPCCERAWVVIDKEGTPAEGERVILENKEGRRCYATWRGRPRGWDTEGPYDPAIFVRWARLPSDPPVVSSKPAKRICVGCDGCGWCEGSPAFKCNDCDGTGMVDA